MPHIAFKPGYKTTEAFLAVAVIVGNVIAAFANALGNGAAARNSVLAAAAYAVARGLAKIGAGVATRPVAPPSVPPVQPPPVA